MQLSSKSAFTLAAAIFALAPSAAIAQPATPNDFYKRGTPTFIVGTAGDESVDRAIRAQAVLIRDAIFPKAAIVDDVSIDAAKGAGAWPTNPVLYGGPHVNQVLAKLAPSLPFQLERGTLTIGEQVFQGDEFRLIACVPGRAADKSGPGYPEFLLYAGTGSPGVSEINAVKHGSDAILVADAFGRLLTGTWRKAPGGTIATEFMTPRARRIAWRAVDRELKTNPTAPAVKVHVNFPKQLPPAKDEEQVIQACLRGLSQAAEKLGGARVGDLSIYVYPDLGSVATLTGTRGDGYAVVEARVLHVVRANPAPGGGLEKLLAHEGTHALAYHSWGAAGSSFLGEGLAVWISGQYGGVTLAEWKQRIRPPVPAIATLLGKSFRQMPENQAYPLAGIFVETAVSKLGIKNVRQHLFSATLSNWDAACKDAGTTSRELEAAFREAMGK